MKKITFITATILGLLAAPALLAQMDMPGMDMGGSTSKHGSDAQTHSPLTEPAKTVFANYFKIQTALAQDSLQGVSVDATAIERAIRFDANQVFSDGAAGSAARDLAKATDLSAAREAFKRLSNALVGYRDTHKDQAGQFVKVFCPMAKAIWLQANSVVNNPYLGKSEASCGQIQN